MNEQRLDGAQLVVPDLEGAQGPERPVTPMDLLTLRDVNNVSISPDGSHVGFRLRQASLDTNDYRTGWFVVGTEPGSTLILVGNAGEIQWDRVGQPRFDDAVHPVWSPDGQWIVYLLKHYGHVQLWRSHRDGTRQEQLTHNDADVQEFGFSPDGSSILFTTGAPRADLEMERARQSDDGIVIDESGLLWVPPAPDLSKAALGCMTVTWVYDLQSGEERPATLGEQKTYEELVKPPEIIDRFGPYAISVSPNRDAIAFLAPTGAGRDGASIEGFGIYVRSLPNGETVELLRKPSFIVSLAWRGDGSELYFPYENADEGADGTSIYAVEVAGGTERRVLTSDYFLRQVSVAQAADRMVCVREGLTEPGEVATVDLSTGELRVLTELNPEFRHVRLSPAKRMTWTNRYGDEAFGHLVEPLDYEPGGRYPLVVTTYRSSGFLRGGVGDEYPIQVLAAKGYFVLSFDKPRNYQPVKELLPAGTIQDFEITIRCFEGPLSSLETMVDKLVGDGLVDPQRTGLSGLSAGAEITNYVISHSDVFHAAAASSGSELDPFDLELALSAPRSRDKWVTAGRTSELDGESGQRWREVSPALNAHRIQAPLLLQVADTEYLCGLQTYNALKALAKPVEMIAYPRERHIKMQPRHRQRVYERNLDWFDFWLLEREDPDPTKAHQYERWRAMRGGNNRTDLSAPERTSDVSVGASAV